jgi:hypothetical protein
MKWKYGDLSAHTAAASQLRAVSDEELLGLFDKEISGNGAAST